MKLAGHEVEAGEKVVVAQAYTAMSKSGNKVHEFLVGTRVTLMDVNDGTATVEYATEQYTGECFRFMPLEAWDQVRLHAKYIEDDPAPKKVVGAAPTKNFRWLDVLQFLGYLAGIAFVIWLVAVMASGCTPPK